jgi:hypothetical protein
MMLTTANFVELVKFNEEYLNLSSLDLSSEIPWVGFSRDTKYPLIHCIVGMTMEEFNPSELQEENNCTLKCV